MEEEKKDFTPNYAKSGFGNVKLISSKGYRWTEKWKSGPTIQRQHLRYLRDKQIGDINALGEMIGERPIIPEGSQQSDLPSWDYRNPRIENGVQMSREGKPLPSRALMWGPSGDKPFYGEGMSAVWNKFKDTLDEAAEQKFGWDREPEDDGKTFDKPYQKLFQSLIGPYSPVQTGVKAFGGLLLGSAQAGAEGVERELGAVSLAQEEISETAYGELEPRFTSKAAETIASATVTGPLWAASAFADLAEDIVTGEKISLSTKPPEWIEDVVQRMSPFRNAETLARTAMAIATGKATLEEFTSSVKNMRGASMMAYSIGAGELKDVEEFRARVADGEEPYFVAQEMSQFGSEVIGQMLGDPLNILDMWAKPASAGLRISNVIQDVLAPVDEFATVFTKLDDVISGAQAVAKSDEFIDAYRIADNVKAGVITDIAQKFGLVGKGKRGGVLRSKLSWWKDTVQLTRTGAAKRHIASKSANHFLGHIIRAAKSDPDDVAEILVHIANLGSGNDNIARAALAYLGDALPDLRIIISDGGMEFGVILRRMLDTGDGTYDVQRISRGLQKVVDEGGEVQEVISYVNQTIGKTLDDIYPTIDELIEGKKLIDAGEEVSTGVQKFYDSGGKIRAIDRLINTGVKQPGILGLQKQISGRVFIGLNPQVALRGSVYDALLTTLEMGPGVMMKSPRQWAEISEVWLGLEHAGLMQGFAKTDIASLNTWAARNSSYKTAGDLIDAIFNKGGDAVAVGMKESLFDTVTSTGGRLLQYFEVQNSQRVIGKTVDDTMKHLLRTAMPKVDELLQAGLPPSVAKSLGERIVSSFADVEKARVSFIDEIIKFESIDKLKQMDWINPNIHSLFDELGDFNLWDKVSDIINRSDGMSKDEVLDGIRAVKDEFFGYVAEHAPTQHAQPNTHNPEVVEALEGFIEEAADGNLPQEFVDETMDMVQANVNTKNSVIDGLNNLANQISKKIRQNAERLGIPLEEINPILDGLQETFLGSTKKATQQFTNTTGRSQTVTKKVRSLSQRLLDSTETLADIKKDIKALLGVDVTGSRSNIKDKMWRVWFSQRFDDFVKGRKAAVGEFWEILESMKGTVPDEILADVMNGPFVRAVIENEQIAIGVEQAIMVEGKLKPVGRMIRSALDFGKKEDALRAILAYANPYVDYGGRGQNTLLLQIANHYGEYESIDDIPVEEAWDILKKWRADNDFPALADNLDDLVGYKVGEVVSETASSIVPPHDLAEPSAVVNAHYSKGRIDDAFEALLRGVEENFGVRDPVPADEDLLKAINSWFDTAEAYVDNHKTTASKVAQEMRDFVLHDYDDRYGVDALMSIPFNFHFWPTRTMMKWGQRIPSNMGIINKYSILRKHLEELHADQPEWMRFSLNTNELLGLHHPNPVYFFLENTVNPFQDIVGGFDDPDKRKNWYSTIIDGLGRAGTGSPSLILQMAAVIGLKAEGEDEAAAKFGGRLIPLTRQIKGATSLMGIHEGRGVELDPMIRLLSEAGFFSTGGRAMGPYEQDRVARAANQVLINNPGMEEELLEQFWRHEGALWDEAIAVTRQASAFGELSSFFTGLTAKSPGSDNKLVNQFWTDYIQLVSQYENLSPEAYRKHYHNLMKEYPFAEYMLLSRRGGDERDRSYAYAILSRIEPGKTDDVSRAAGFDYDILGYFYDNKGDLTKLNEKDRVKFMTFISELGATLAIPDNATRSEWIEASSRYGRMREIGMNMFGEDIWDRIDRGYELRGAGWNSNLAWQNYLDENPDVELALQWQSEQIFLDPILGAYYGSISKLRDYGTGLMYQKLEDEFGSEIFDTYDTWKSYSKGGQTEEAKAYKLQHPELTAYEKRKKELTEEIREAIIKYGDKIPDGEGMRLLDELEDLSEGEREIIEFMQEPETLDYGIMEWRELIGKEAVSAALMVWQELDVPADIMSILEDIARDYDMTLDELIMSVGSAGY